MSELVATAFEGGALYVTLCRPDKRNALSRALIAAIAAAFGEWAGRSDVAVAVLTGSGDKAFASVATSRSSRRSGPSPRRAPSRRRRTPRSTRSDDSQRRSSPCSTATRWAAARNSPWRATCASPRLKRGSASSRRGSTSRPLGAAAPTCSRSSGRAARCNSCAPPNCSIRQARCNRGWSTRSRRAAPPGRISTMVRGAARGPEAAGHAGLQIAGHHASLRGDGGGKGASESARFVTAWMHDDHWAAAAAIAKQAR